MVWVFLKIVGKIIGGDIFDRKVASQSIVNKLATFLSKIYPQLSFQVILKNTRTIASYFSCKNRLPSAVCANFIYNFSFLTEGGRLFILAAHVKSSAQEYINIR